MSLSVLPLPSPTLLTGAYLSGSFHAVTGPDHLAALLPRTLNRPLRSSPRVGLTWGLGHGLSVTFVGLAMYLAKKSGKALLSTTYRGATVPTPTAATLTKVSCG